MTGKNALRLTVGWQEDGASFALAPDSYDWVSRQQNQVLPARVHLMLPSAPKQWEEVARDAARLLTGMSPSQLAMLEFQIEPLAGF